MTDTATATPRWRALTTIARALRSNGLNELQLDKLSRMSRQLSRNLRMPARSWSRTAKCASSTTRFMISYWLGYGLSPRITSLHSCEGGAQDLSDRSIVRQVLTYQGIDRSAYNRSIRSLFGDAEIRNHLRDVALTVLRDDPDPDPPSWTTRRTRRPGSGAWSGAPSAPSPAPAAAAGPAAARRRVRRPAAGPRAALARRERPARSRTRPAA